MTIDAIEVSKKTYRVVEQEEVADADVFLVLNHTAIFSTCIDQHPRLFLDRLDEVRKMFNQRAFLF